jgi:hypothetical protein
MVTEERRTEVRELLARVGAWAATDPVDPGTRRVVRDGMSILYDPGGLLERLAEACRQSP